MNVKWSTKKPDSIGLAVHRMRRGECEKNFPVYSICYKDGELREVKVRQYEAWDLDPEKVPLVVGGPETPAPVAPPGG